LTEHNDVTAPVPRGAPHLLGPGPGFHEQRKHLPRIPLQQKG